jgi:hypothetical protein
MVAPFGRAAKGSVFLFQYSLCPVLLDTAGHKGLTPQGTRQLLEVVINRKGAICFTSHHESSCIQSLGMDTGWG